MELYIVLLERNGVQEVVKDSIGDVKHATTLYNQMVDWFPNDVFTLCALTRVHGSAVSLRKAG